MEFLNIISGVIYIRSKIQITNKPSVALASASDMVMCGGDAADGGSRSIVVVSVIEFSIDIQKQLNPP